MYSRFVEQRVRESLADTRVVLICGPRQSGKTTLARQIAADKIPYFTFDDPATLKSATDDPIGFVRLLDRAVIDEVHRVPEVILAIKLSVDSDTRAGRFLLTGSANLLKLSSLADSLTGRMGIIRLLPLSQAELHGNRPSFLERAFAGELPNSVSPVIGQNLNEIVLTGGYPEVLNRSKWHRRHSWHLDYIETTIQRDVSDIAKIEKMNVMPKLIRVLAEHSGQLINYSNVGDSLDLSHVTTKKYAGVFENLFLIHNLQPWYTNKLKRLIKTPKLHFLDSGLLAALKDISPENLILERRLFGPLLESFVFGEILKLASWSEDRFIFSHYRDKEQNEVDIVMEDRRGRIVGVEVKASATVSRNDFSGLRKLAAASGNKFVLGLVLHDHDKILPFGDKFVAAPISTLWS